MTHPFDLEPADAELERCCEAYWNAAPYVINKQWFEQDEDQKASVRVRMRAALAVRSAPEAGKAVGRDFYLMYDHQTGKWCVQDEPFKVIRTGADVIHTKEIASPGQEWEREVADLVRSIAEWDDRTSPEDYPDHLLLTPQELTEFARSVAVLASVAPSGAEPTQAMIRNEIARREDAGVDARVPLTPPEWAKGLSDADLRAVARKALGASE